MIEGRLQLDQWQDKETGAKKSKLRVVAEMVQFLSKSDKPGADSYEAEGPGEEPPQYQPPRQQYQAPRQAPPQQQYQAPPPERKGVPPMPDNAFKVGDEAEDDIPF
jgi:single-strand DNA-binding protein